MKKNASAHIFMSLLLGIIAMGILYFLTTSLAQLVKSNYPVTFRISSCDRSGRDPTSSCYGMVVDGKKGVVYDNLLYTMDEEPSGSTVEARANDDVDVFTYSGTLFDSIQLFLAGSIFAFFSVIMFRTRKERTKINKK